MMIGKYKIGLLICCFLLSDLLAGPLGAKFLEEQLTERKEGPFTWKGLVNWRQESIQVKGIGAPPKGKEYSKAQWRPMALRAAKVVGLRDLAEVVYGVRVTSETTVHDSVIASDVIKTKVDAFIKGFSVSEPKYMSDGTVEVIVSLPLYGRDGLSDIMYPTLFKKGKSKKGKLNRLNELEKKLRQLQKELEELKKEILEQGRLLFFPFFARNAAPAEYTGLIVEGKNPNPGIRPAMAPRIVSESGQEVYGTLNIDPETAIEKGIVSYSDSVDAARSLPRVGDNPMVVHAIKFSGSFKADPVIKDIDAQRIASSNLPNLFPYCPVVIVTN